MLQSIVERLQRRWEADRRQKSYCAGAAQLRILRKGFSEANLHTVLAQKKGGPELAEGFIGFFLTYMLSIVCSDIDQNPYSGSRDCSIGFRFLFSVAVHFVDPA